jgi:hypothetical protein
MVMVDAEEESGLIVARMTGSNVEIIKKNRTPISRTFPRRLHTGIAASLSSHP